MRSYKWFLTLASILFFLGLVAYHGYRWVSSHTERYLLTKVPRLIQEAGGEKASLDQVKVSFNKVYLENIEVSAEGANFSADEVEVSYNPIGLLKTGFDPVRWTNKISFINPNLTIKFPGFPAPKGIFPPTFNLSQLPQGIIRISGGQVAFVDPSHRTVAVLREVEGRIDHREVGRARVDLHGELVGVGEAGPKEATPSFWSLNFLSESSFYRDVQVIKGRVRLSVELWEKTPGDMGWSGWLEIKEGLVRVMPLETEVRVTQILLEGDDEHLLVKEAKGEFDRGRINLTGRVTELAQPKLFLRVEAEGLDMSKLGKLLKLRWGFVPEGTAKVTAQIEGPLQSPIVSGKVTSDCLVVSGWRVTGLKAKFRLEDKILFLDRFSGRVKGGQLRGFGQVKLGPPDSSFDLILKVKGNRLGNLAALANLKGIKAQGDVVLHLQGWGRRAIGEGSFRFKEFEYKGIRLSRLAGEYSYRDDVLRFSGGDGKSCLQGVLFRGITPPTISAELRLVDVPVDTLLSLASPHLVGRGKGTKLSLTVTLAGPWDRFKFHGEGTVFKVPSVKGNFKLDGQVVKQDGEYGLEGAVWTESLKVNGFPYVVRTAITLDGSKLRVKSFSIDDYLLAEGTVGLTGARELVGRVKLIDADLSRLANILYPPAVESGVAGGLWGTIFLSGSLEHPRIYGKLRVDEGAYHGLSSLALVTEFNVEGEKLSLDTFELYARGTPLMVAKGIVKWGEDLKLWAWGERVNAAHLAQLLSGRSDLASGQLSYRLELTGGVDSPKLKGWFSATEGRLLGVEFDRLDSKMVADNSLLTIQGFKLQRDRVYRVLIRGRIPHDLYRGSKSDGAKELDLKVDAEGDILTLLPSLTEEIVSATGQGKVNLRLGGTSQTPTLVEARVVFSQGAIKPRAIPRKVTELQGEITKTPDSEFLHIKEIAGKIEGKYLRIYNREKVMFTDRESVPLILDKLGVNLGVLIIETEEGGIKINIPGLMFPGKRGRLELGGKAEGEPFCISGPTRDPLVRGTVKLEGFDFTYPVSKGEVEGRKGDFMRSIDWDVRVVVGRNVWYRGELAHLRIDEGSFLDFQGSVARGDFLVLGQLRSTEGTLVYLDTEFNVEEIGLEFDRYDRRPWLYGRAKATISAAEAKRPTNIYLSLYSTDPETGERVSRARWGEVRFALEADDPELDTQEKVLARMGYGKGYLDRMAQLIGSGVDLYLWRPMVQPLEIHLKRALGLDVVQLRPSIAKNLISRGVPMAVYGGLYSGVSLLQGSKLTLGQQLFPDLFFTYTGQITAKAPGSKDNSLGIKHQLGLEFNINPSTRFLLEYDYNRLLREQDKRIRFEHHFLF